MGHFQYGWMHKGTLPLLLKGEEKLKMRRKKRKKTKLCRKAQKRRIAQSDLDPPSPAMARAQVGRIARKLDLAETQQDLLLQWRSMQAFPCVCLGRVMHTQGTIETTSNNGGTKWLALIKSRLLWFIFEHCHYKKLCNEDYFSFHMHQTDSLY